MTDSSVQDRDDENGQCVLDDECESRVDSPAVIEGPLFIAVDNISSYSVCIYETFRRNLSKCRYFAFAFKMIFTSSIIWFSNILDEIQEMSGNVKT